MKFLEFAEVVGKLKSLKRTGWIKRNVPMPESVAEHSFRVALMAMALAKNFEVDEAKVLKMALLHDLGEATIGDIVTYSWATTLANREDKLTRERQALKDILELIDQQESTELFDEIRDNATPKGRLVNQLDKLEMAFQAAEYEEAHGIDLKELHVTAEAHISDPRLLKYLAAARHKS